MIDTKRFFGIVLILIGFSGASSVGSVWASDNETDAIETVRFDPVEMHFGDSSEIEMVPKERLGEMPVPILEDAGNGFVKVLLPDGSEGWVNRGDVQIGGVEVKAICARERQYSQASDRGSAHLRGISRNCN